MRIPANWVRTFEFACHDASCAPPPAGTGGSSPSGGGASFQRHDKIKHPKFGPGRVLSVESNGDVRASFEMLPDIKRIPAAEVSGMKKVSPAPASRESGKTDWRYKPRTRGSDDGYDAMKDAGYNSRYHRPRFK